MNFITFPSAATNLFPAANDTINGQLLTEFNLKSRESVATDSNVIYNIGPSYVHSDKDFEVKLIEDETGVTLNSHTLQIEPGKGVINGHYVETLVPMTIDLVEANLTLSSQARPIFETYLEDVISVISDTLSAEIH